MQTIDMTVPTEGIAIASGLIVGALIDALVKKDVLTRDEVATALEEAMFALGARFQTPEGFQASQVMASVMRNLPEGG